MGRARLDRRRAGPHARPQGADAARLVRQELALQPRRRSHRRHPALAGARRRRQGLSRRGFGPLPAAPARRVEPPRRQGRSDAPVRAAGDPRHGAGVLRRGGARSDRARRAAGGHRAPDAPRGAAGRVLCVVVRERRRLAQAAHRRRRSPGLRRRGRHHRLLAHLRRRAGRHAVPRARRGRRSHPARRTWRSPTSPSSASRPRAPSSMPGSSPRWSTRAAAPRSSSSTAAASRARQWSCSVAAAR